MSSSLDECFPLMQVTKIYQEPYMKIFADTYSTVHRLETGTLRNVAKFFAHLFFTDAIGEEGKIERMPWSKREE